jgi:MoaA/NifB/PqqE/SkfB family radical SAM enzyme
MKSSNIKNSENLIVEITSNCNLHCPQCPRFDAEGNLAKYLEPSNLNFEMFSKNFKFDQLPNLKHVKLEGDYGDALMHPDVNKFIDFFQPLPSIELVTNGSLRSKIWWEKVANYKNLSITFSIDGLEDTNHVYRINSKFSKIIENATAFISAGGSANWKFIVFKHNQHQIDQARELALNLGFKQFEVIHTNRSWFLGRTWPVKISGEYQYTIEPSDIVKDRSTAGVWTAINFFKKNKNLNEKITCLAALQKNFYINHKGHVMPCCASSGLTWQDNIAARLWKKLIGTVDQIDITKNSLEDIFASDFYANKLDNSLGDENSVHPVCISTCANKLKK